MFCVGHLAFNVAEISDSTKTLQHQVLHNLNRNPGAAHHQGFHFRHFHGDLPSFWLSSTVFDQKKTTRLCTKGGILPRKLVQKGFIASSVLTQKIPKNNGMFTVWRLAFRACFHNVSCFFCDHFKVLSKYHLHVSCLVAAGAASTAGTSRTDLPAVPTAGHPPATPPWNGSPRPGPSPCSTALSAKGSAVLSTPPFQQLEKWRNRHLKPWVSIWNELHWTALHLVNLDRQLLMALIDSSVCLIYYWHYSSSMTTCQLFKAAMSVPKTFNLVHLCCWRDVSIQQIASDLSLTSFWGSRAKPKDEFVGASTPFSCGSAMVSTFSKPPPRSLTLLASGDGHGLVVCRSMWWLQTLKHHNHLTKDYTFNVWRARSSLGLAQSGTILRQRPINSA